MHYEGDIIRPPSEADSILLQVTTGCPHNTCTFCGAYPDGSFSIKPDSIIQQDLRYASQNFIRKRRLFLCDGDSMAISFNRMSCLLEDIRKWLPQVTRVGTYASAMSLGKYSDSELKELQALGLGIVYMGLESGDNSVLRACGKHALVENMIAQAHRLRAAGIKLNVSVILGLGGKDKSVEHAIATGKALSAMQPDQIGALSLMLVPGTPLHAAAKEGRFRLPDALELLRELRLILEHTDLKRGLFFANHASNYLPLRIRLPKGKAEAIALLDEALAGKVELKPEWMRGL